ncbi:efflux RND transporter periplasmic adaptor subunit [Tunturiibacter gelidoferens]|jgi:RND family efflux transporter MFP subunit|uniref:RND family efflux transporter MFP subunit n=1 Tax=Tunturiibacter gelidiferens TaxID=3069689 RepID=A0A9X0Q9X2_9BACT|nr:efflux RND transporter periplasmic adaptor subunit [Edaphobacter lichenicola]MBB5326472.1 RND family efflux transporter MFP subunit [Edaphobacter lichenicola]
MSDPGSFKPTEYRAKSAFGDMAMSADEQTRPKASPEQSLAKEQAAPHDAQQTRQEPPKISRGSLLSLVVIVLVVAVVVAVFGIVSRKHASAELKTYTENTSAPPVTLEKPVIQKGGREIVLPGNMQAFTLAPIYARTTGYVKAWYHDIGTPVRKGELLAVIETPELDQQLASAKADLATAKSNAGIAKVTSDRYGDLIGRNAVSQQDTDTAAQALEARNTQVASAQANVQRLEELVSFERIVAPFDGVITARNLDIGQLITATGSTSTSGGANSANREIFDISAVRTLRVFINVPQIYSPDAKNGTIAKLTLPQYPGRTFEGKLVRSSDAVDPATRTLLAEVDVDNRSGELLPGSYTEVHLNVSSEAPVLVVPVSSLILEPDGLRVATVDANHHVHMARITPGRDYGTTVEVLAGLKPGDSIVGNPPDSLTDGEEVRVVTPNNNQNQAAEAKR